MGRIALLTVALAAGLALGACRDEEQGRTLQYDKGSYAGRPDTPLSPAAREALRERIRKQGGLGAVDHAAGGGAETGGDVRPPGAGAEDLRGRSRQQGYN